jgi:hypothetical protein
LAEFERAMQRPQKITLGEMLVGRPYPALGLTKPFF